MSSECLGSIFTYKTWSWKVVKFCITRGFQTWKQYEQYQQLHGTPETQGALTVFVFIVYLYSKHGVSKHAIVDGFSDIFLFYCIVGFFYYLLFFMLLTLLLAVMKLSYTLLPKQGDKVRRQTERKSLRVFQLTLPMYAITSVLKDCFEQLKHLYSPELTPLPHTAQICAGLSFPDSAYEDEAVIDSHS